ncbi:HNH endonuclease [Burkholderia glumae]|uniref:HNH endonuclease n=1 Tax=Burkholderia glumae TaxID=337 RepID=UPI0018DED238|nr:HNH endonuclease [Burkholderia glumae]
MRIALRTSGGRGEYEVAGSHENIKVHDVFDREIILEMMPGLRIQTNNVVRHTQGKPRIRLVDSRCDSHVYLILSAMLLLPKPKREIGATPIGKLQVYQDNFSVTSIPFDVVELNKNELIISPTHMILSNSSYDTVRLDVIERLRIVMSAWEEALRNSGAIGRALLRHKEAFHRGDVSELIDTCQALRLSNVERDDPLRYVTNALSLARFREIAWMGIHSIERDEALALGEENLEGLREAARNRLKVWRLQASRGVEGARFSNEVKLAYNNTCLFTGFYLPKTYQTGPGGVDAAHILPWAEYDLNKVSNGLCLSKLCHWAFDAGVVRLRYNPVSECYMLRISRPALDAESHGLIDLTPFRAIQGAISNSLLPSSRANWPNPLFLNVYNEALNL